MTINVLTLVLHVLSVVIWVGGMFFAYVCLRPIAASQLEPPVRLQLWVGVFGKFFPFVWIAVILLPLTGYMMISNLYDGMGNAPLYVHLMNGTGSLMIFVYLHVFFAPYQRLKRAVAAQDWPTGGKALAQIRVLVGVNTALGLLTALIASGGRFFG